MMYELYAGNQMVKYYILIFIQNVCFDPLSQSTIYSVMSGQ